MRKNKTSIYWRLGVRETNEMQRKLKESLLNLPEENQKVINLYFLKQIPRKNIALQLNWSLSKVNQKITRGITLLKKDLDPAHFQAMDNLVAATAQRRIRK